MSPVPIQWGAGVEQQFTTYLATDLQRALTDRSALERKWAKWLDQYRAPTTTATKTFPWHGASNRTLPFTAMNADPLIARFVTTLTAPQNLWTLQPLNERWTNAAKPMQDFLQYLSKTTLHMSDVLYRSMLEFVKLGTCILKTGWTYERTSTLAYQPDGTLDRVAKVRSQPFVDHVALQDFVIPPESFDIQPDKQGGAPWVAERFYLREAQLLARAKGQMPFQPDYDPVAVDKVKHHVETISGGAQPVEAERWKLDMNQPSHLQRIELFECHCRYDTTGTGTVDDVVVVFHLPSRTILRAALNPYRHGRRPYDVARYFRGDGFYGIGECEQSEVFQEMLTQLWNYQMDNVLAVNAPMIGVKLGANVVANEPIYPLKQWILENPDKDIREIKLSEVYPSLAQFAAIIQSWGERRTGMTDIQQGDIQRLPSRTPATTMVGLMQEGNRRFDLSLRDYRDMLDQVGVKLLQNTQQFLSSPEINTEAERQLVMTVMMLGNPEGGYVAEKILMPIEDIEAGLGVNVTATSGNVNKEVEKQAFLSLLQLQGSLFVPLYLQLSQILANPQVQLLTPAVAQTAGQLFTETVHLQTRLYEQFDQRNIEDLVPDAALLLDTVQATAAQSQLLTLAAGAAANQQEQQSAGTERGGDSQPRKPAQNGGVANLLAALGKPVPGAGPAGNGAA